MSESKTAAEFSSEEFDAIEAAVMETNRGRQFLEEYGRRHRVQETGSLLEAIARLENLIKAQKPAAGPADTDLDDLACAIAATCEDIASVRNDMLADHGRLENEQAVFASLTGDATQIASALISTAEALQASIADLRETGAGAAHVEAMDASVSSLFENGWRQDILAQRITKAMRLLTHLQDALGGVAREVNVPQFDEPAITAANLKFFAQDENLFEPVEDTQSSEHDEDPEFREAEQAAHDAEADDDTNNDTAFAPQAASLDESPVSNHNSGEPAAPFAHLDEVEPNPVECSTDGAQAASHHVATEVEVAAEHAPVDDAADAEAASQVEDPELDTAETPAPESEPELDFQDPEMPATQKERNRIFVIRTGAKSKPEIPFADGPDAAISSQAEHNA